MAERMKKITEANFILVCIVLVDLLLLLLPLYTFEHSIFNTQFHKSVNIQQQHRSLKESAMQTHSVCSEYFVKLHDCNTSCSTHLNCFVRAFVCIVNNNVLSDDLFPILLFFSLFLI